MIDNLDRLSKASGDRFFNDAERQMRANLSFFRTWADISKFTAGLKSRIDADLPGDVSATEIATAAKEIETATSDATKALKDLQDTAKNKFNAPDQVALIGTWFARLGDLGGLIDFAAKVKTVQNAPPGFLDAAKEAAGLAAALGKMYGNFNVALAKTPDMAILEAQVQLLQVNEDHLKQLTKIITQREEDMADTRHLLRLVETEIKFIQTSNADPNIAHSIASLIANPGPDTKVLGTMLFVLYNSAALASRDNTAKRLASLRLAEEERRFSVRSSAVAARSYETVVSSGVERLANYYKGGLKPETLAQIANALATLGLIPTIAVK